MNPAGELAAGGRNGFACCAARDMCRAGPPELQSPPKSGRLAATGSPPLTGWLRHALRPPPHPPHAHPRTRTPSHLHPAPPAPAESSTGVVDFVFSDSVVQEATKPSREQVGARPPALLGSARSRRGNGRFAGECPTAAADAGSLKPASFRPWRQRLPGSQTPGHVRTSTAAGMFFFQNAKECF